MPQPYKDMAPILDMFGALIRSPKIAQILKNWKESLSKGMLHFGTKERLSPELSFNLLIYQHLTPTASKSGNRCCASAIVTCIIPCTPAVLRNPCPAL